MMKIFTGNNRFTPTQCKNQNYTKFWFLEECMLNDYYVSNTVSLKT